MSTSAPVLVIGASSTAVRLCDELLRSGVPVVLVQVQDTQPVAPWVSEDARALGVDLHTVAMVREAELRAAGVEGARAVVVVGMDEVSALRVALLVEELNPAARIVLEMAGSDLGARLEPLLGECVVLSSAELAAPSFVAAAIPDGVAQGARVGGRTVMVGRRGRIGGTELAVLGHSLSQTRGEGDSAVTLTRPGAGQESPRDIVIGTEAIADGNAPRARQRGWWGAFVGIFDRRLRFVIAVLLALVAVSALFFHFAAHLDWWSAIYVALTASTLTGLGGDIATMSLTTRFFGVIIQLVGLVLSSGITAVIVDALLSARLGSLVGGVRGRPKDHHVVVGLGAVGTAVAGELLDRGLGVVAIERREDAPGVQGARRRGIPVVIGEASDASALAQAGVSRARAVLAVTDSDPANLQTALLVRQANPDVRVVTRLFDHDLASRLERQAGAGATLSVSMLAAPSFAAAALDRAAETVVPIGRRVVLLTEVPVARTVPVRELGRSAASLVLAVKQTGGEWNWEPTADQVLQPGSRVAVAATRAGLGRIVQRVQ